MSLEISRYRKNHSNGNEDDNIQMDFHLGLTVGFLVGLRIIFCVFCLRRLGDTRISAYLTKVVDLFFMHLARYKPSKHYIYDRVVSFNCGAFDLKYWVVLKVVNYKCMISLYYDVRGC
jgi:hypothetical protein